MPERLTPCCCPVPGSKCEKTVCPSKVAADKSEPWKETLARFTPPKLTEPEMPERTALVPERLTPCCCPVPGSKCEKTVCPSKVAADKSEPWKETLARFTPPKLTEPEMPERTALVPERLTPCCCPVPGSKCEKTVCPSKVAADKSEPWKETLARFTPPKLTEPEMPERTALVPERLTPCCCPVPGSKCEKTVCPSKVAADKSEPWKETLARFTPPKLTEPEMPERTALVPERLTPCCCPVPGSKCEKTVCPSKVAADKSEPWKETLARFTPPKLTEPEMPERTALVPKG